MNPHGLGDVTNALCIDLDDLAVSHLEAGFKVRSPRLDVVAETEVLLDELELRGLRATFFVPGHFLTEGAALVPGMLQRGHEVASHGTLHAAVESLGPDRFREDVVTSKQTLEDLCGREIDTYKAPMWSITPRCLWAYEVLGEAGFRVDHSAMPAVKIALGRPADSAEPFATADGLVIIPATSASVGGRTLPLPGGFYNAWVPFPIQRRVYDRLNERGTPFNFYFHPFEFAPHPDKGRGIRFGSFYITLYSAHAGRYRSLLDRVADRYRLGTLRESYARWIATG